MHDHNFGSTSTLMLANVVQAIAELNNGKVVDAVRHFNDRFLYQDHAFELEFSDKGRLTDFFQKRIELFPDIRIQIDSKLLTDDHAVLQWHLVGTISEPFWGKLSRAVSIQTAGSSIISINDGLIESWADYYDGASSRWRGLADCFTEYVEY